MGPRWAREIEDEKRVNSAATFDTQDGYGVATDSPFAYASTTEFMPKLPEIESIPLNSELAS